MDGYNYKEVFFSQYCNKCKYKDLPEIEAVIKDGVIVDKKKTICFDCQEVSVREGSHIPEKFEEA